MAGKNATDWNYYPSELYRASSEYLFGTAPSSSSHIRTPTKPEFRALFAEDQPSNAERPCEAFPGFSNLLAHNPGTAAESGFRYSLSQKGLQPDEQEVVPIGPHTGIAGKDRLHVVHELKRLRNARSNARRRNLAVMSGVCTLIVTAATVYMLVCDCISMALMATNRVDRDNLRMGLLVAGLSCRAVCFFGELLVLFWCRYARRQSTLSKPVFSLALLCFLLHLILASLNFLLVMVWRSSNVPGRSAQERCKWGVDFLWLLGQASGICPLDADSDNNGNETAWIVATCIRFLAVLMVGTAWMHVLRLFCRSLRVASIIDPNTAPDEYVRTLLEKKSVKIVPLNDKGVRRTPYDPLANEKEYLPPMPERQFLRAEEEEELNDLKRQQSSWRAMFWGGLSWLFGSGKYEGVKERPDSIYRTGLPESNPTEAAADLASHWEVPTRRETFSEASRHDEGPASWIPSYLWPFASGGAPSQGLATLDVDNNAPPKRLGSHSRHDLHDSPFSNNPLHPDFIPPKRPSSVSSMSTLAPLLVNDQPYRQHVYEESGFSPVKKHHRQDSYPDYSFASHEVAKPLPRPPQTSIFGALW